METIIKEILKIRGVAINEFAKKIPFNRTQVYEVSNGYARASAPLQRAIADELKSTTGELFDEHRMARLIE